MQNITRINRAMALGFEELESALDHAAGQQSDGYPPYNIERSSDKANGEEIINISLAVAGFTQDLLEVVESGQHLTITGKKDANSNGEYLHQGIAMRQFQRNFILADCLKIKSATLKDGLLNIELRKPEPKITTRKVPITAL